jgi:hypothetical protein
LERANQLSERLLPEHFSENPRCIGFCAQRYPVAQNLESAFFSTTRDTIAEDSPESVETFLGTDIRWAGGHTPDVH